MPTSQETLAPHGNPEQKTITGAGGFYLADRNVVPFAGSNIHLNAFHQPFQLFSHISSPPHRTKLDEILIAPLHGVTAFHPLREKGRS